MALASAGCEMPSSSLLLALALSCQGCGLQNWRLWRLCRLCSVMAGGTARPAAAEGEAGHEPGTGWPGPQVAALGRGARAPWQAEQARHMVYPRCRDGGPAFPAIISSVQSKEALDRPCMAFAKLEVTFFVSRSVFFARYSDVRYLVVWVCIPGLVNGTASATRAPCGQAGRALSHPLSCAVNISLLPTPGRSQGD